MKKNWVDSYSSGVPETINPDAYRSIADAFEKIVDDYKDLPACSNYGVKISFNQLEELSRYFAASMQQQLGLKKGDRVAIMLPNLLQYPIVMFGLLRAGLVVVNVNPLYTETELEHQLKDSGATSIIILANMANVLEKVLEKTDIKNVIVTEIGDLLGFKGKIINFVVKKVKKMVPAWNIPNAMSFNDVLESGKSLQFNRVMVQSDDIAFLQYTGGTTGVSKGAILTHHNMIANMLQCVAWIRPFVNPGKDVVVTALPLYHIFSLTVCCMCFLLLGSECLLITNPRDMKGFMKILKKIPGTIFVGVNTLFNGLLNQPNISKKYFSKIKMCIGGGMAVQKSVAERWKKLTGVVITEGYGLTEASPVVTINPMDLDYFSGSIGLPIPATDVVVRDDDGNDLAAGERGELWVKGPQVMKGYWNNEAETANVMDADGWLRTGDIVCIDDRGFVHLVDRKKDMVLVSGFNVYPGEVEEVIAAHSGVVEVAVIGVQSEKTGEAIKAFVVSKDLSLTEQDIIEHCRHSLTAYKIPKLIEFTDELPKSNVGKVLRRELRENNQVEAAVS